MWGGAKASCQQLSGQTPSKWNLCSTGHKPRATIS